MSQSWPQSSSLLRMTYTGVENGYEPMIWTHETGQWIPCSDRCQLTINWMSNIKPWLHIYGCQFFALSKGACAFSPCWPWKNSGFVPIVIVFLLMSVWGSAINGWPTHPEKDREILHRQPDLFTRCEYPKNGVERWLQLGTSFELYHGCHSHRCLKFPDFSLTFPWQM